MRRQHAMPFGAQVNDDGTVRFRLWAPAARHVAVLLDGRDEPLPMAGEAEGWFELETARAGPGDRYHYQIDGGQKVPDPASRFQPGDVHGPSEIIDPRSPEWHDGDWRGRPWTDCVIYEAHVGTFTPGGDFTGMAQRLDYLADLGVTALEIMPVADFPGRRSWGYDGVFPFAPDAAYGRPEALKALVQAAHQRGLMVFMDVVYNHFGPEGNYLHQYAPSFFTDRHHTPWGAAINYDGEGSRVVRDFVIHNALYWLEEYHVDGLRLDAVHAILDDSRPDVLTELAERVRGGPGRHRHIHLVLENDDNAAHYLARDDRGRPRWYDAQWNDDIHHAWHVLLTGERSGYYRDFDRPLQRLSRCLTEGFAYQDDPSVFRDGRRRGERSAGLPPTAFTAFIQNHDQVGNRAFGERIGDLAGQDALRAATAVLLLAPNVPLLFMGQEWDCRRRFPFFCDFSPDLAGKVTEGRRREFAGFEQFRDPAALARIPDPNDPETFAAAHLDWQAMARPPARDWHELHRRLLHLRREVVAPLLAGAGPGRAMEDADGDGGLGIRWPVAGGGSLLLEANLAPRAAPRRAAPAGTPFFSTHEVRDRTLPPWFVAWYRDG